MCDNSHLSYCNWVNIQYQKYKLHPVNVVCEVAAKTIQDKDFI